jgi:hypothetical protein
MADNLDPDMRALKEWLRGAWQYLADQSSTRFERREIRNYMKEVEAALRSGFKSIAVREKVLRDAEKIIAAGPRLDFRIFKLDT